MSQLHSYTETKRFINNLVKKIDTPLVVTSRIREILRSQDANQRGHISEGQFETILKVLNTQLTRYRRQNFKQLLIDLAAKQVLKNETNRIIILNENLVKISTVLTPINVPEVNSSKSIEEVIDLISKLPDSKTLLDMFELVLRNILEDLSLVTGNTNTNGDINNESEDEGDIENQVQSLVRDDLVVVDDMYSFKVQNLRNKLFSKEVNERLRGQELEALLTTYQELRGSLIKLGDQLQKNVEKLEFLKNLLWKVLTTLSDPTMEAACYEIDSDEEEDINVESIGKNFFGVAGDTEGLNYELERFKSLVTRLNGISNVE